MKFKFLPDFLRQNTNNVFNKNERLATNVVNAVPASTFDMSHRHMTTFDSGKLVPVFQKEMLPGDQIDLDLSVVLRLSSPNAATMENAIYDVNFFFVPNRIVWENWKYFMGENKSAGFQQNYKQVPIMDFTPETTAIPVSYTENDLASYLGLPCNKNMSNIGIPITSLKFKAYAKIWNDHYRDENLQPEIDISNNNAIDSNVKVIDYWKLPYQMSIQAGVGLAPVSKLPDYFTTCLPYPQKGASVDLGILPLQSMYVKNADSTSKSYTPFAPQYETTINNAPGPAGLHQVTVGQVYNSLVPGTSYNIKSPNRVLSDTAGQGISNYSIPTLALDIGLSDDAEISPYNINDLRLAITLQHYRELDARGGTRYTELLLNHFGVHASDARVQRSEYIGGMRSDVVMSNVVQTSSTVESGSSISPLGVLGGVSVSQGHSNHISYSCEEHGIIIGVICVRPQLSYCQGIFKDWTKTEKLDFYDPVFANIGEQPIHQYEILLHDSGVAGETNMRIFGYNEPWAEYRYSLNQLSGYISTNAKSSLSVLYAYTQKLQDNATTTLNAEFMECKPNIIGSTLLINPTGLANEYINQFLGDFYFNFKMTRRMPVFSIPGVNKI